MDSYRVLIIDDEPLARSIVREFLQSHPECETIGECTNGIEAVKAINESQPDIVFLDIQMPKLNGFEVLELLEHRCGVIFATAYDEFALKAFEVQAVDYLLKPFSQERFDAALARAKERLPGEWESVIAGYRRQRAFDDRIIVKDGSAVHVIAAESVDYIEAQDDYIAIHVGKDTFLKKQTISEMESRLNASEFMRVHRSFILRLDRLARIELYAKDSRIVILKNGKQLPISRSGYEKLKSLL